MAHATDPTPGPSMPAPRFIDPDTADALWRVGDTAVHAAPGASSPVAIIRTTSGDDGQMAGISLHLALDAARDLLAALQAAVAHVEAVTTGPAAA